MTVSGCVSGTVSEAGVGAEAVKEAVDELGVVVLIGEVFELASEAEVDADSAADAEPVNNAEIEAGDKAGAEAEAVPAPKSVAVLGLAVSGYETYYTHSSEVAVA